MIASSCPSISSLTIFTDIRAITIYNYQDEVIETLNSFGAKFQTTNVVCFDFFNKLSIGNKFICKVE